MNSYRSLLVGVDFSPCSTVALQQAMRLNIGMKASLQAIHVIDTLVAIELEEVLSELQKNIRDGLMEDARRAWKAYAVAIPSAAEIPFHVTINNRVVGILKESQQLKSDLLILGAFGQSRPDVGFGTIATACVRSATCDVLLARDTQQGSFKSIIVGVDFSDNSAQALRRAAQFAKLDNAALHVVHVFDPPWHRLHYRTTTEVAPNFMKQYSEGLRDRLDHFARTELSSEFGAKCQCVLFNQGSHRSGIVAYAQQVKADLVVLGTHGRTNIRDLLLGSTAENTLKLSTCSVLAVKAD